MGGNFRELPSTRAASSRGRWRARAPAGPARPTACGTQSGPSGRGPRRRLRRPQSPFHWYFTTVLSVTFKQIQLCNLPTGWTSPRWAAVHLQYQPTSRQNISQICQQKVVHDHTPHPVHVVSIFVKPVFDATAIFHAFYRNLSVLSSQAFQHEARPRHWVDLDLHFG